MKDGEEQVIVSASDSAGAFGRMIENCERIAGKAATAARGGGVRGTEDCVNVVPDVVEGQPIESEG
jgi:hypothetical protein